MAVRITKGECLTKRAVREIVYDRNAMFFQTPVNSNRVIGTNPQDDAMAKLLDI